MEQSKTSGETRSYEAHRQHTANLVDELEERLRPLKENDSVNYQLMLTTLNYLKPFLGEQNTWLTIGDYLGSEANFLLKNGQEALASDLSDVFLKAAKDQNLIKDYEVVNVEKIHFSDDAFEYVFCKEAYHHFPRAFLGLYEMIRVAKKAAILIEPIDILSKIPSLLFVKNVLDKFDPNLINKIWKNRFSFEPVGNYVFKVSERELEKMAMGIAFKRVNINLSYTQDPRYHEVPMNQALWRKIMRKLAFKNNLSKLGITPYNHLICAIFKQAPDQKLREILEKDGYEILDLPKNPYLT